MLVGGRDRNALGRQRQECSWEGEAGKRVGGRGRKAPTEIHLRERESRGVREGSERASERASKRKEGARKGAREGGSQRAKGGGGSQRAKERAKRARENE